MFGLSEKRKKKKTSPPLSHNQHQKRGQPAITNRLPTTVTIVGGSLDCPDKPTSRLASSCSWGSAAIPDRRAITLSKLKKGCHQKKNYLDIYNIDDPLSLYLQTSHRETAQHAASSTRSAGEYSQGRPTLSLPPVPGFSLGANCFIACRRTYCSRPASVCLDRTPRTCHLKTIQKQPDCLS